MSIPDQHTTDVTRPDPITEPGREGPAERAADATHDDATHESTELDDASHREVGHGGAATSAATDPDPDFGAGAGAVAPDASRTADTPAVRNAAESARPAVPAGSADPSGTDAEGRERLVPRDRADDYGSRWDAVKGTFVDEPRQAVRAADELVGELLEELEKLFRKQRQNLEHGLDADETTTEDLRLALRRYRSFFDRLLSL